MHAEQEKYERLPFKTVSAQSKTIGQFKVFILYSSMWIEWMAEDGYIINTSVDYLIMSYCVSRKACTTMCEGKHTILYMHDTKPICQCRF